MKSPLLILNITYNKERKSKVVEEYLENEGVEKETKRRKEESEERKKEEITISWEGFMLPVNGVQLLNPIH
jgi:hypothetical protein